MPSRFFPSCRLLVVALAALLPLVCAPTVGRAASSSDWVTTAPSRLLDTRPGFPTIDGRFSGGGKLAAGKVLTLDIAGRTALAPGARAVALNITATAPNGPGFLTVFPCGAERPVASNVNYTANQTIAGFTLARLGAGQQVCIYSHATTHVIADIAAWLPAESAIEPLVPRRLLDTRPGHTTFDRQHQGVGKVGGGQVYELPVASRVPGMTAGSTVWLNVTATGPEGIGHIRTFPCGQLPNASTTNYEAGQTIANSTFVPLSENGSVCVFASTTTDIVVDMTGFSGPQSSLSPIGPLRLMDTRPSSETIDMSDAGVGSLPARSSYRLQVAGRAGVPDDAVAAVLNITSFAPASGGYFTVYPCDTRPEASNLNVEQHTIIANAVFAPLGPGGSVCVYTSAKSGLIVDVTGYGVGTFRPTPIRNSACPNGVVTVLSNADCAALAQLYRATGGTGWTRQAGWGTESDPCTWYGVTCNTTGIIGLNLAQNGLSGAIPAEIGTLNSLERLDLFGNDLTGLPTHIANLTRLVHLDLDDNKLTSLPPAVGSLTQLHVLRVNANNLTALPDEIGQLRNLRSLEARHNQIAALPTTIGALHNLTTLDISDNAASGLPTSIGHLTQLVALNVGANQISSIPPSIGHLDALVRLDTYDNLIGELPTQIGALTRLRSLDAANNRLTTLPDEVGSLAHLRVLLVSDNQLSALPATVGGLGQLLAFSAASNQLTELPSALWQLTALTAADLSKNQIATLSPRLGQLSNLTYLNVSDNDLTLLPSEVGQLTQIERLYADSNRLTALPASVTNLTHLTRLSVDSNQLTGLPDNIGNLSALQWLWAADNQLTTIPTSVGRLRRLYGVDVHNNRIVAIPSELATLPWLSRLDLSENRLTDIPTSIHNLRNVMLLRLSNNHLSGRIDHWATNLRTQARSLQVFDLSGQSACLVADQLNASWLRRFDSYWNDRCR